MLQTPCWMKRQCLTLRGGIPLAAQQLNHRLRRRVYQSSGTRLALANPRGHLAILRGYSDEESVTDEFMIVWRASVILGDMLALATRPDRRSQAQESLRRLVGTFE